MAPTPSDHGRCPEGGLGAAVLSGDGCLQGLLTIWAACERDTVITSVKMPSIRNLCCL